MYYTITLLSWLFLAGCSSPENASYQIEVSEENSTQTVADTEVDITAIELLDLDGNPISWEALKGKKVFLNFWATWCKPCIIEMPSISEAAEQLGEEYVFLVASYEDLAKIQKFTEKRDFTFQFVHTKTPIENLNIYSLPTTFLINSAGELVETVIGSKEWNDAEAMNQLKALP
ncbi:TlpA family protein disulfide reductase [Tunicatimonas pelagia]|uniref:TlpA family protein disulfide reductase n=1 Tax=Tunicatimonas pelagia TaxID=931531 RepID=UPI002666578E|nr:TlpA disulfide reductase family protein [Tunicatimonas pelagia]WKN40774.1 TlpA disulfide reductase family protein [Tunicatimonas pelagia]